MSEDEYPKAITLVGITSVFQLYPVTTIYRVRSSEEESRVRANFAQKIANAAKESYELMRGQ